MDYLKRSVLGVRDDRASADRMVEVAMKVVIEVHTIQCTVKKCVCPK